MAILHNGNEYSSTKIINYSAAPDYNKGVTVDNIQSGNYQATDNGFLMIQLQSQQSNPTKVSVIRSKTPITDTGTEIASIVLSQYQYSETLTAQVMARDYYKLVIEGVGNPQVLSCIFYPYASNVPIKLTEDINIGQVVGLEGELDGKQNAGNYATNTDLTNGLSGKQDKGDYATNTELNNGLATKQNKGNYFNKDTDILDVAHGGHGGTTIEQAQYNLRVNGFYRNNYERLDLNKATNGVLVARMTYLENIPTHLIASGELIIETVLGQEATTFSDNGPYTYNLQTYRARSDFGYAQRVCAPNGAVGEWKKLRNDDGSIPAGLINLPVGFSYIQASGTNTPDVVFSTTGKWQEITNTATGFPSGTRIWKKLS